MDIEELDTPQNFKSTIWAEVRKIKSAHYNYNGFTTPTTDYKNESSGIKQVSSGNKKNLLPKTPNRCTMMQISNSSTVQLVTAITTAVNTPPAKRIQHRVRNPFEAALTERLHLPLIGSPSLFDRPATPQLSSTQFEWTIDEVSSLQPAHVEPHETQFHDSPDPEYEAKAQSAISSYFKDHQIVPSPVDCPLRNKRIILSELNGNTPLSKPGRRIRDCGTQTELTLPFNLPKELEDALKPYFQPQLAGIGKEWRGIRALASYTENLRDTSLRRKLFDMHNIVLLDQNTSPQNVSDNPQTVSIAGKLSDSSSDKSACDFLSPISANDGGISFSSHSPPLNSPTKRKVCMRDFGDELSPILPPQLRQRTKHETPLATRLSFRVENHHTEHTFGDLTTTEDVGLENNKFSPDRSSSPATSMCLTTRNAIGNFSSDSFNIKISRLAVNSAKCEKSTNAAASPSAVASVLIDNSAAKPENELFLHDDTADLLDEEDDMQVSQLSVQSSNCSSTNSDTPRNKRRSASRKNLSQSFSASWLQAEEDDCETHLTLPPKLIVSKINDVLKESTIISSTAALTTTKTKTDTREMEEKLTANQRVNFYRTDSGFNEMTTSSSVLSSQDDLSRDGVPMSSTALIAATISHDVSMSCCSTPTH